MEPVIAVLDIGKTNKKTVLFDMDLEMRDARRRRIEPILEDGIRVEDVHGIEDWFLEQLRVFGAEYDIRAIAITTHGASAVCVGSDGAPSVPPVDYTQPVDGGVRERFFAEMGSPDELQVATATAEVQPLINVGTALFYLKECYPEAFANTKHVLFFPQYFAFRLTGVATADITYTGCHTYLWDYRKRDWSVVADRLGIRGALPGKPVLPSEAIGNLSPAIAERTGLSSDVIVAAGIHDSNASLLPYLITREKDFVLNSTGTWCVAMRPTDAVSFAPDEVGKMVFYNLSYAGAPVKTSILLGGLEYETYHKILADRHNRTDHPGFDAALVASLIEENTTYVLPSVVKGAGQFPESDPRVVEIGDDGERTGIPLEEIRAGRRLPRAFGEYERALAIVDLSVAIQTVVALKRVGLVDGTDVFIEGGFRNNETYLALLTALLPNNPVSLTSIEEATSFGAALCGHAALTGRGVEELSDTVSIEIQRAPSVHLAGIDEYAERLGELSGGGVGNRQTV